MYKQHKQPEAESRGDPTLSSHFACNNGNNVIMVTLATTQATCNGDDSSHLHLAAMAAMAAISAMTVQQLEKQIKHTIMFLLHREGTMVAAKT
jgi:hypothetical protein